MRYLLLTIGWFAVTFSLSLHAANLEFHLTTHASDKEGKFKTQYTCDGKDISPALSWENPPSKTQSYALILVDPDAPSGNFYHWLVLNIPANISSIPENKQQFENGIIIGKNSFGRVRYNGPCPPTGKKHHYIFTLYALDTTLPLSNKIEIQTLLKTIETHSLANTISTAFYEH